MNTIKCLNCGHDNKNTNIRCDSCGKELNHIDETNKLVGKKERRISNSILIFFILPFLLSGILFIGISLYFIVTENIQSRNYIKTEGKLVDREDCEYDDDVEVCDGVYEYRVNGISYRASTKIKSIFFRKTKTVKYNPNNPSEYVIHSGWIWYLISGVISSSIFVLIYISIKREVKKLSQRVNDINKEKQIINS